MHLQTYPFNRLNPTLPSPLDILQKGEDGFPVKSPAFVEAVQNLQSKSRLYVYALRLNVKVSIGTLKKACRKRVSDVPRLKG